MKLTPQAKVGILTIVALIVFAGIVTWKNDLFLRAGGVTLVGNFQNVEGLGVGSEVRYRGFKVGKVMNIDPEPSEIKVYSLIDRGIKFPADSYLRVAFDGIVGLKYLDIRPGTLEALYVSGPLEGRSTAGIVDFVDMGAQNLVETKAILQRIRMFIDDPRIVSAFQNAVFNSEKVTEQLEKLAEELRVVSHAVAQIVNDPAFQANIKQTVNATSQTLTSANSFFETVGNLSIRPSGQIYFGNNNNEVRGNLDMGSSKYDYLRLGIGEGPTTNLTLQDILMVRKSGEKTGFKIGMINTRLGGGLDYSFNPGFMLSSDIYDINNKPGNPRVRFTTYNSLTPFIDLTVRADNVINGAAANYSFGIQVQAP